jgi:hypothetical protein
MHLSEEAFRQFKRKDFAELRPHEEGEDIGDVSVSAANRRNVSPKKGDMIARNPDDHSDQWLVARKFFRKHYVGEAGGSGYSAAFTHPDPLDPNDRVRQKTQARQGDFPYDGPTLYGGPIGTDMGGAVYQRVPDHTPPKPQHKKASDEMPYGEYGVAWEQLESLLDPYSPGDQADDALSLGYGSHGRMGEEDGEEIDIDPLQALLRSIVPLDRPPVGPKSGLMVMLMPPEDEIVPADDGGGDDLYSDWGERVYAPGAEDDPI